MGVGNVLGVFDCGDYGYVVFYLVALTINLFW